MIKEKSLPIMLKEIGYNDSPLRKEVVNVFKKYLQQKLDNMQKGEFGEKTILLKILKDLEKIE